MRIASILFAITLLLLGPIQGMASGSPKDPLVQRSADVVAEFRADPDRFDDIFSPSFLQAVPPHRMKKTFIDFFNKLGPVTSTKIARLTTDYQAQYLLTFHKGYEVSLDLVIDEKAPHLITGLWIGTPTPIVPDWQALITEFAKLTGKATFTACKLGDKGPEVLATYQGDEELAIGSALKLFVLGALMADISAGKRRWTDIIVLKDDWKSLPSGFLQDWTAGSPLTLYSLAALMISQSDNTATDHLIHTIGREHIEQTMVKMGLRKPDRNLPFLTTREMFLLKGWDHGRNIASYLAKDEAERRAYLQAVVSHQDIESAAWIGANGQPTAVDQVEWFASSRDMVRAMNWIRCQADQKLVRPALDLLAINHGIAFDREVWSYVGYKGGSEPGVRNMTFLLHSKARNWYAMSASLVNTAAEVDEDRLSGLLKRASELLLVP
ncbi:MAG: serine hydrolase [Cyanobacteria bacterium NC_groundwater_1444_Ag_S-0.65um_54_12]|nr:serine hydrolase [Cyanobacteria bacterium NC_groundwater_1444_Ag_S-0.65um_54_12]